MELEEAIFGTKAAPERVRPNAVRVADLLRHMLLELDRRGELKGRFQAHIKVGKAPIGRLVTVRLVGEDGSEIDCLNAPGAPDVGLERLQEERSLRYDWSMSPNFESLLSPYGYCERDYAENGHCGLDGDIP